MIKHLTQSFLNFFGYKIVKLKSENGLVYGHDDENEAKSAIKIVDKYTMITYPRLVSLYGLAKYCEINRLEGSFVECGVWKGGAMGLMAIVNMEHGVKRRKLHLFDVFDDICEPDDKLDGQQAIDDIKKYGGPNAGTNGKLKSIKGGYDAFGGHGTIEGNKILLETIIGYNREYIKYHKGWFQDTLPDDVHKIDKIALLRLDGDWYSSTKICLDYLYDKVINGGIVIVDDYGHSEGCKKAVDQFLTENNIQVYLNHDDYSCRYWIKP